MSRLNPSLILMLSYMAGHIYEHELQTHKRFKKKYILKRKKKDKTQSANFRGNPLCQVTV